MKLQKVQGIIISESNYSETSKLLKIITKEYGLITVMAKGAKSIKSKIRAFTTKLTYADFQIYYKENKISTLISADIIDPFINIKSDLLSVSYASFILELTNEVLKESNNTQIFDILVDALIKINEKYDPVIITNILELKYLDFLGIKPNLDSCAVCGNTNILTVSTNKGGFVCKNCHTNEKILDSKTIKILRMLYYVDIKKISKINIKDEIKKEIDNYINEYYDKYSGLYVKSKKFLKNIKNSYI